MRLPWSWPRGSRMRSATVLLMQDPVRVSGSIGIAMSPPIELSDLLRLADVAMYRAKELGGGRSALVRDRSPLSPEHGA